MPLRPVTPLNECESGAAILEFALALPVLLVLVGGAFELGRALLLRETMIEAVRSGAVYLARVPDPSCEPSCSLGVTRAIAMTRDQIAGNAGLPRTAVAVSSSWDAGAQMVSMKASLTLDVDILRIAGFGPTMTVEAIQRERRLAE